MSGEITWARGPRDAFQEVRRRPTCRVVNEQISVHWYPAGAPVGASCYCGQAQRAEPPEADRG